jgi:hypothetical protein
VAHVDGEKHHVGIVGTKGRGKHAAAAAQAPWSPG